MERLVLLWRSESEIRLWLNYELCPMGELNCWIIVVMSFRGLPGSAERRVALTRGGITFPSWPGITHEEQWRLMEVGGLVVSAWFLGTSELERGAFTDPKGFGNNHWSWKSSDFHHKPIYLSLVISLYVFYTGPISWSVISLSPC